MELVVALGSAVCVAVGVAVFVAGMGVDVSDGGTDVAVSVGGIGVAVGGSAVKVALGLAVTVGIGVSDAVGSTASVGSVGVFWAGQYTRRVSSVKPISRINAALNNSSSQNASTKCIVILVHDPIPPILLNAASTA